MKTLAERRREFVQAKNATPDAPALNPNATAYELMLAKLASDKRRLKQVQSVERKVAVKRELLPDYEAWVSGVLAGDKGGQDDVVATIMVWKIDVGEYGIDGSSNTNALALAEYVLRHGLTLPDNYVRTPATLIAEEIAEEALREYAAGWPFKLSILERADELTRDADMPDEVRAKLIKAIGLAQEAEGNLEASLAAFTRALELHDRVGVKKDIERIQRAIKAAVGATHASPAQETDPAPSAPAPKNTRRRK
jgi:tetratricopeptide (TPR) repeat protein